MTVASLVLGGLYTTCILAAIVAKEPHQYIPLTFLAIALGLLFVSST